MSALAKPVLPSQRYRARAENCRAMAARFHGDFARRHMLKAADDFERIARDAQQKEIVSGMAELGEIVRKVHGTE